MKSIMQGVFFFSFFPFLKDMRIAGWEPPSGDSPQRLPGMSTLRKGKSEKVRKRFQRKCWPRKIMQGVALCV